MKNILTLIIITLLISSCGTKKEMVEDAEPVVEQAPPPQSSGKRIKKPRVDADKLVAQLGLSEAQEKEFLYMWNKTADDMMDAREDNIGNRNAMRTAMKSVRDERQAGLQSILTDAQMTKYYEIMDENRKKMGGAPIRHGG